jgi:DNA-binding transcriptional MerR regulator
VDHPELSNKLYFKIGEVAKIVGVKPYVLRYWETEFPVLKPGKTPSRHRLYRRRDVETLLEIKRLLYQEGFTIAGAKKRLKESNNNLLQQAHSPPPQQIQHRQELHAIREDLRALYKLLDKKPGHS